MKYDMWRRGAHLLRRDAYGCRASGHRHRYRRAGGAANKYAGRTRIVRDVLTTILVSVEVLNTDAEGRSGFLCDAPHLRVERFRAGSGYRRRDANRRLRDCALNITLPV